MFFFKSFTKKNNLNIFSYIKKLSKEIRDSKLLDYLKYEVVIFTYSCEESFFKKLKNIFRIIQKLTSGYLIYTSKHFVRETSPMLL